MSKSCGQAKRRWVSNARLIWGPSLMSATQQALLGRWRAVRALEQNLGQRNFTSLGEGKEHSRKDQRGGSDQENGAA
jgi:hypothetical protein